MNIETMQEKIKASGLTMKQVAKKCGISKSSVSQIINGKYKGREDVVVKVQNFLEKTVPETPSPGNPDSDFSEPGSFVPTPAQKTSMVLLDFLRTKNKFGLIIGPSGIGKTRLLEEYEKSFPEISLISVRQGQSMGGLLTSLCKLWSLPHSGTIDTKMERLLEDAPGRFLVVDEADSLSRARRGHQVLKMVEVFRYLYDAGAGVCLVGLPSIYQDIVSAADTYVYSRIKYATMMDPPTRSQLTKFWLARTGANGKYSDMVVSNAPKSGYFRYLAELADAAKEFGDLKSAVAMTFNPNKRFKI